MVTSEVNQRRVYTGVETATSLDVTSHVPNCVHVSGEDTADSVLGYLSVVITPLNLTDLLAGRRYESWYVWNPVSTSCRYTFTTGAKRVMLVTHANLSYAYACSYVINESVTGATGGTILTARNCDRNLAATEATMQPRHSQTVSSETPILASRSIANHFMTPTICMKPNAVYSLVMSSAQNVIGFYRFVWSEYT